MEKTLLILKPSAIQRELVGTVLQRFERKGLRIAGLKMMQLTDALLDEHYAHLKDRPFFQRIKNSMMITPVIVCCLEGKEAVQVVRKMAGTTNACNAEQGTIRGDFALSMQENIVHTSDSVENAAIELARFFAPEEIFEYTQNAKPFLYANDEA